MVVPKYIAVIIMTICSLMLIGCKSNSIKGKWRVIGVSVDKINDYDKETQLQLLNYKPSKILYSDYRNGILINYLGHSTESINYYMSGRDMIIFYGLGFRNDTSKVLTLSNDSVTIRSNKGAIIKMVRVNNIPGS